MSNPNPNEEEPPPPGAQPFDPSSVNLSLLATQHQAQQQLQQAQFLSALQNQWGHPTASAAANNPLYAMLAQQHQMQLLQQQAAMGLFLPSPTNSNAAVMPAQQQVEGDHLKTVASLVASLERPDINGLNESWYDACRMLGVEGDGQYLSRLQCLLRGEVVEVFGASEVCCCVHSFVCSSVICFWFKLGCL